jgi:phage shock protein A
MFTRLRNVIRAKLSRFLDRVEDPIDTLDLSYTRQAEQLAGLRSALIDLVIAKKRIARQCESRRADLMRLEAGARRALEAGDEKLARRALERRESVADELDSLGQQVDALETQQVEMVAAERAARTKLARFRTEKEVAKARYSAAKASVEAGEGAAGISGQLGDVGMATQHLLDQVDELRVRAGALEELERDGTLEMPGSGGSDDLDRQIRQLTRGGSVDAQLQRMKTDLDR